MIFPVGDVQPRKTAPIFNVLLIVLNTVLFFHVFLRPPDETRAIIDTYALVPSRWQDFRTLVTSMFLHGDLWHLLGNMLFLWTVGNSVEDRMGHLQYLVFYLFCGLAGAAAHVVLALGPLSSMAGVPTIGASGAISGIVGAYLALFPASRIRFMVFLFIFFPTFTIPSWGAIGLWVAMEVLNARAQLAGEAQGATALVAVFAHLGGFAFGFGATFLLRVSGRFKPRKPRD